MMATKTTLLVVDDDQEVLAATLRENKTTSMLRSFSCPAWSPLR